MNKNLIITIVIGLLAVAGLIFWMMPAEESVNDTTLQQGQPIVPDSTASINQSLDGVNVNEVDGEFKDIDADLNSL